jgi:hypothetical protein
LTSSNAFYLSPPSSPGEEKKEKEIDR